MEKKEECSMNTPARVLVIGSANADYLIHTDRMPRLGETLAGSDFTINAGGKGLNQAVALAKLGADTAFLGAVGDDEGGRMLLDTLAAHGIAYEGSIETDVPTGVAIVTVVGSDNFILLNAGANDRITPDAIRQQAALIRAADYVVLQLEIPTDTVAAICDIASEGGTRVVLNPAPYKELPPRVYAAADYLIPNEHEAQSIVGISPDTPENAVEAVRRLRTLGARTVIITLGERGCVYNDGDEIMFAPAAESRAVDTTSAGDSFIGALVSRLSNDDSLADAIAYASRVAAITVSRHGAARSIPYAAEVE